MLKVKDEKIRWTIKGEINIFDEKYFDSVL